MVLLLLGGLLAGCSGWNPENDRAGANQYQKTPDGYYRVRRGDTLYGIAFGFGVDWKSVAAWNGIRAPYTIYPDQQLRMSPPARSSRQKSAGAGSSSNTTVVKAAPSKSSSSKTVDYTPEKSTRPVAKTTPAPAPALKTTTAAQTSGPEKWLWPVEGRIISNFKTNDPSRKGIDIGGKEGQPVVASAGGEVVYSGSGLIGYGELIIIKHNEQLLSAYAHNRKRLVKEGQKVSGGERIAEMGKNDRSQAMLHFEIRLNGTPQDPLKYLPGR